MVGYGAMRLTHPSDCEPLQPRSPAHKFNNCLAVREQAAARGRAPAGRQHARPVAPVRQQQLPARTLLPRRAVELPAHDDISTAAGADRTPSAAAQTQARTQSVITVPTTAPPGPAMADITLGRFRIPFRPDFECAIFFLPRPGRRQIWLLRDRFHPRSSKYIIFNSRFRHGQRILFASGTII